MSEGTVKFNDPRKVIEVELPSFKGSVVKMWESLLVGKQREIVKKFISEDGKRMDTTGALGAQLVEMIKSWNFVDEEGKPIPITVENLDKLPMKDLSVLTQHVEEGLGALKFKSEEEKK